MPRRSRNDNAKLLGKRIREIRLAKGWSQEILAFHCNLDRSYVGSLERGERNPNFKTLCRVAKALGINVTTLLVDLPL
jgi:transcriptional regulator with XRE-family HTH domain